MTSTETRTNRTHPDPEMVEKRAQELTKQDGLRWFEMPEIETSALGRPDRMTYRFRARDDLKGMI